MIVSPSTTRVTTGGACADAAAANARIRASMIGFTPTLRVVSEVIWVF
jgi:hypothetical protein